ncbi:MAG: iron chelate uptake ABC transporter family permease subunit [Thermomicrobiales bacterium]
MNRSGQTVDFGYRLATVRLGRLSVRFPLRAMLVSAVLLALASAAAFVSLRFGEYPLTAGEVLATLTGEGDDFHRLIVMEWRLPISVAAVAFGAVLGLGGAIFQSLTRNPLGSPDVIGFDTGTYTAVVIAILVIGTRNYWTLAGAAVAGGIATALLVYVLAWRRGIQSFRLIIVGIGVSAILGSANAYLVSRAELEDAMVVGFWSAGSIRRVTWDSMGPALLVTGAIVVSALALSPALRRFELGDDAAVTLGTRVNAARLALIVVGISGSALVTAAAGPISFIALVAPQVARRLTRTAEVSLAAAACMGAALLAAAYLLSVMLAEVFRPIPVGLITISLGGAYLIGLLVRETRRRGGVL